MPWQVFGEADWPEERSIAKAELYKKAIGILLTRVELKHASDRLKLQEGVREKLEALRRIAFERHLGEKRDFTQDEVPRWRTSKLPRSRRGKPTRVGVAYVFNIFKTLRESIL